jgi:hypothetical protein
VEYIFNSEQFFGQTRSSEMSAYAWRNNSVFAPISYTVSKTVKAYGERTVGIRHISLLFTTLFRLRCAQRHM